MNYLTKVLFFSSLLFFVNGCGSSDSNNDQEYTYPQEVNGPAGMFEGATEFVPEMFVDRQTIYAYDKKDAVWIAVVFTPTGEMIYENNTGIEVGSTYDIVNGKIFVNDSKKSPTITLDSAEKTTWEVTGEDNDGAVWQGTWYLELKFKREMLEGKCYLSKYNDRGEIVNEKVCFKDMTLTSYTLEGEVKQSVAYTLKDNAIAVTADNGDYTLYLMSITQNTELNVWYKSDVQNYANNAVWVQTSP